ncbi:MAG: NAD(P)-dependent oxidoreductase [Rickettsiales bacterium]|nr:NAD(P)-dependent oxidoreductase [Rickettsiales bacterium]
MADNKKPKSNLMGQRSTVVVTGSQGFIGGYLVKELLKQGYKVIGIDNFSKYGIVKREYDSHPNFELIVEDLSITNKELRSALKKANHLIAAAAKIGGISYFHSYAYDLLANNERIMANTCDAAIEAHNKFDLKKITHLSSSMVFENTNKWPSKEGEQFLIRPPSSAYGFQKLAVEYFAKAAWDQYQLPYTIIRVFNCVGVGEARALNAKTIMSGDIELAMSHVLPDLVQKVLKGQDPLRILGSGNQIRHLTYGGDLAKGIVLTLDQDVSLNTDLNISTDEGLTVLDLARKIWEKIKGPNIPFAYVSDDPFPYDVQKRIPDTTKIKELLGFKATTSIDEVIDEVIPWVENAIKNGLI